MRSRTKTIVITAVVAAGAAVPAIAQAGRSNDDGNEREVPIVGADLERAAQTALAHMGQGRVTGTEVGDEESYYEVEVTLDDGRQVDVQLDEGFAVVGTDPDAETPDD